MEHDDIFEFDDRLVRFAGEMVLFIRKLKRDEANLYYGHQLLLSSGSSCLNCGEAQGTITPKDFMNNASIVLKVLKESRNGLKVLAYIKEGETQHRSWLSNEVEKLIAITQKMIDNKR